MDNKKKENEKIFYVINTTENITQFQRAHINKRDKIQNRVILNPDL